MPQLRLADCLRWTSGKLHGASPKDMVFDGIGSDTRKNLKGKLFVALKGDNYDAHQFLDQAIDSGAAGLLVHEVPSQLNATIPIIVVPETLRALQDLAHEYRKTLKTKFIGITGSNGKTSTKEFTAALLKTKFRTHWNEGSFNSHWGVPFNILGIEPETEIAIVEMGMNHFGELQRLAEIAVPDVVVCTMVGRAHIEFFGTIEKIAQAKEEIYQHSPRAKKIFSLDQDLTIKMSERYRKPGDLTFSSQRSDADVYLKITETTLTSLKIQGRIQGVDGQTEVGVFGRQNLTNLMAAAAIALACGMTGQEVWQELPQCKTTWGRNQLLSLRNGAKLLFDAYNANPDSMKALLENIQSMKNQKLIGVFGQMGEQGDHAHAAHCELGEHVGKVPFEKVFFIGTDHQAFEKGLQQTQFTGELYSQPSLSPEQKEQFLRSVDPQHLVVMKASRGTKLERFLDEKIIDPEIFKKS